MARHAQPFAVSGKDLKPLMALMAIMARGETEERVGLARVMGNLIQASPTTEGEARRLRALALALASDPDVAVRRALADALAGVEKLDSEIVFAIVSDIDPIALPFLSAAPGLTASHMLAVLRVGDVARQACLALRPDLPPEIASMIVEDLSWPVNQLLLENSAIALAPEQYWLLHERFGDSPVAMDALLARADLPAGIRILQARKASLRLRMLLAERRWLPARAAAELLAESEDNAIIAILAAVPPDGLAEAMAFLEENDLLTPSILLRAACRGAWPVVIEALAMLAGLPGTEIERHVLASGRLQKLAARAGLPAGSVGTLRAAHGVAVAERADVFRLSADEFGEQVIEALLAGQAGVSAAQQAQSLGLVARFGSPGAQLICRRLLDDMPQAA